MKPIRLSQAVQVRRVQDAREKHSQRINQPQARLRTSVGEYRYRYN